MWGKVPFATSFKSIRRPIYRESERPDYAIEDKKKNGEPCWIRTSDLLIKSQLLYRLS
jgi:hypothetical protein